MFRNKCTFAFCSAGNTQPREMQKYVRLRQKNQVHIVQLLWHSKSLCSTSSKKKSLRKKSLSSSSEKSIPALGNSCSNEAVSKVHCLHLAPRSREAQTTRQETRAHKHVRRSRQSQYRLLTNCNSAHRESLNYTEESTKETPSKVWNIPRKLGHCKFIKKEVHAKVTWLAQMYLYS